MTTTAKRWNVEAILKRASDLEIEVLLVEGNLELHAAPGVLSEKATAIFREYKQEIIDYLRSQYSQLLLNAPTRCTCCGMDMEQEPGKGKQFYYDAAGQCYCEEHWIGPLPETQERDQDGHVVPARPRTPQEQLQYVARRIADAWPGGIKTISEVEPRITLKEHLANQRPQQHVLVHQS